MKHFIKTQDEQVAEQLRKEGYTELSKENNSFVFINDSKKAQTFDKKKIIYTDNICV